MAKTAKGKKGKGADAPGSKSTKKCTCDHPYNCDCGNRPPRPSRGHKWDPNTQEWGGKGHTQKGGSGQTRVVAQTAKTTSKGQTQMEQWQKLPSQLVQDFCLKQKRPPPKFKELFNGRDTKFPKSYKCRCIVPDAKLKNRDKDLIFIPAVPVSNEEQAKEEAALLALLELTPNLPHERKLPEPYKSTWLNAINASKKQDKAPKKDRIVSSTGPTSGSGKKTSDKATVNHNLMLGNNHISSAQKRKETEERRNIRNARLRRHEAIRMANRNHPVFLSAKLRNQIQNLLQGNRSELHNYEDEIDDSSSLSDYELEHQEYIEERLHTEGFTRHQARKSFQQLTSSQPVKNGTIPEDKWDDFYEECLQWLCVHLPEDQLPEGFDPRGSTLDVASPSLNTSTSKRQNLASRLALYPKDAAWLLQRSAILQKSVEATFWEKILELSGASYPMDSTSLATDDVTLKEEIEALEAMFSEDLQVTSEEKTVSISMPLSENLALTIVIRKDHYPAVRPDRIICTGDWAKNAVGTGFHIEIAKFVATMMLGEPMIFEIYSQVQEMQQDLNTIPLLSLTATASSVDVKSSIRPSIQSSQHDSERLLKAQPRIRRPREQGVFWSTPVTKMPPASAFPKLGPLIEHQRSTLPAAKARSDFLTILNKAKSRGRVVLVTGDTGCGKTTQIPQFILEEAPKTAKIVVAQPRRLAATGVAARVSDERGESKPGIDSVGYVVRGDSAVCKRTRLLFCTFGILLRQLHADGALDNVTHIVIDEVHERNLDGDVLMALLRQYLKRMPDLCVILMSATLDADRFASYWGTSTPRMHIPGRTFPVEDFFLEDALALTGYNPPKRKKKSFSSYAYNQNSKGRPRMLTPWNDSEDSDKETEQEYSQIENDNALPPADFNDGTNITSHNEVPLEEKVRRVDESSIDYDLLGCLVRSLINRNAMGDDGSILVFLPGAPEINQAKNAVAKITQGMPLLILPLHGGLQPKEQNVVFRSSPNAVKVILSTNVAETSITIPDCTVVIDGCREKQSSYDPISRMPMLIEVFASQASLKQRRGRSGRVRKGQCYKLISKATYEQLHAHTAPEITRCALDQTLLTLLSLGVEEGNGVFLKSLLDPPKAESITSAFHSLLKLGALHKTELDEMRLTPLGMHLSSIPASPTIGKMLIMGAILGCRRAALAMAAGMSTGRSPFLRINSPRTNSNGQESIQQQKDRLILAERSKLFEESGNSDHAMLAAVFLNWDKLKSGGGERKRYCEKLGLAFNGMKDILQLVNQYDSALSFSGYTSTNESDRNSFSWKVLRTCAVSAMSPGQLVRVHRPSTKYESTAEGAREKDGVAKELKFFVRIEENDEKYREERVFIHPSSALFSTGNFSCPWLVFNSMVKTSKPFLRDATECSSYALLLFGGPLTVEARNNTITIDGWVNLSANARIGALIRGLRAKFDEILSMKVNDPSLDVTDTPEMKLIVKLLLTDGMG